MSHENLRDVLELRVAEAQRAVYPRSNAESIAEGHYPPDADPVWIRAVYADETPVGFLMTSEAPEQGEYFLWRMMIDARYQGRGYGQQAIARLLERLEATGTARVLWTSHLAANTAAGRFYEQLGFEYTGEEAADGDRTMRLRLSDSPG